jgi:putative transposase
MNVEIAPDCTRQRFPPASIGHAAWRSFRFALRYRDVEELRAERGAIVTDETIRQWCQQCGQPDANSLRRRRPRPGEKWHRDAVFVSIDGAQQYPRRAVDRDGNALDILVQPRRDKRAAVTFLRRRLKGLAYVPPVAIADKLARYGAAVREVLPGVEHRRHKGLTNRAGNSHRPTRERERRMRRFKDPGHAQRFLAAYGPRRHRPPAEAYCQTRAERFATRRIATGTPAMA